MTNVSEIRKAIEMAMAKSAESLLGGNYYVLFFVHKETGELFAYDTKEPLRCYRDIVSKHPEYEFARVDNYDNESAVRDVCRIVRVSREMRSKILPGLETLEIKVVSRGINVVSQAEAA